MKIYKDHRGWKYKVMPGISGTTFKGRFQKPESIGSVGWKCMRQLPWRDSMEGAQADLDRLAEKKGWKVVS